MGWYFVYIKTRVREADVRTGMPCVRWSRGTFQGHDPHLLHSGTTFWNLNWNVLPTRPPFLAHISIVSMYKCHVYLPGLRLS